MRPLHALLLSLVLFSCSGTEPPAYPEGEESALPGSERLLEPEEEHVSFRKFESDWLHDLSAVPALSTPRSYLVREERDLHQLPLPPSALREEAFRDFDFSTRTLIFVIHPEQASSANELVTDRLELDSGRLSVRTRLLTPMDHCPIPTDLVLVSTVVSVTNSSVEELGTGDLSTTVRPVLQDCI